MLEHLHKRFSGTVEDWHLDGIDVDENIVDFAGIDGGEQMLGGGEQDALLHQASRITDAGDVFPARLNDKIVQVRAPKNDTGIGRGGYQAHMTEYTRVEADPLSADFTLNCSLKHSPSL